LPISQNPNIPKHLGLRHRAGLGISQETDAKVDHRIGRIGKNTFCFSGKAEDEYNAGGIATNTY
jgi:hypothetical protein